jgi:signal transduction histidine kinase
VTDQSKMTSRGNRRVGGRLGLTGRVVAAGVAALLVLVAAFVVILIGVANQRDSIERVQAIDVGLTDANALQRRVVDLETGLRGFVITDEPRFLAPRDQAVKAIPPLERKLSAEVAAHNRPFLRDLYRAIESYSRGFIDAQLRLAHAGKFDLIAGTIKNGEGKRRLDRIRRMFAGFYAREAVDARAAREAADSASNTMTAISIVAFVLAPLLVGLMVFVVARFLARPLKELSTGAKRLGEGDLSARVRAKGGGEIGVLKRTFNSMAEELQQGQAELEERNKELESFSYSVSHDLRAPLRSIDGFSQALVEDFSETLDDQGRDYLRRIRGAAARMAEQIDDLLRLSRVSRSEVRREPVDFSALAHEVAEDLAEGDPERRVQVEVEEGLRVDADRRLLHIALENLIGNAWKFTGGENPGRIEVASEPSEKGRAFLVRDNGAGFDMAYSDKLFGVFQRLHSISEFDGTGVGLATVQRIVSKHDGQVWAEAEVGQGATFHFTLGDQSKEASRNGS